MWPQRPCVRTRVDPARRVGQTRRVPLAQRPLLLLLAGAVSLACAQGASAANPTVHEFSTGLSAASGPNVIARGPDGAMWFTQFSSQQIGRVAVDGTITEYPTSGPGL